jgi:hypothetical protein
VVGVDSIGGSAYANARAAGSEFPQGAQVEELRGTPEAAPRAQSGAFLARARNRRCERRSLDDCREEAREGTHHPVLGRARRAIVALHAHRLHPDDAGCVEFGDRVRKE